MILNSPKDFLSLHENIKYYNTHKNNSYIDNNLNVTETDTISKKTLNNEVVQQIFNRIEEYYIGSNQDDKWLVLLKKEVKNLNINTAEIINKINVLQQHKLKGPQSVDWLKLGILNVVSIFDQSLKDENGALRGQIYRAIRSQDNIVITPKEVFTNGYKERWSQYLKGENLVMFEQKESGFLVFIPKNYIKTPNDLQSSLAQLDLDPNQLKQVTLEEIYSKAASKSPNIEQWEALWSKESQLKKRWYITGHGKSSAKKKNEIDDDIVICSFKKPDFEKLINAIKKQKSEFSCFCSCNAGRTILESQHQFFSTCNFPILVEGRVDTPTYLVHLDNSLFWVGIDDFLKNSQGKNISTALKEHMKNYYKELPEFQTKSYSHYYDQPTLLLPHSEKSPLGFKTVEGPHTKNVQTLTYVNVKAAQLKLHEEEKGSEITVPKEKNIIELYPPVIDVPLRLSNADVHIHSLIPGRAHHYIQKITLEDGSSDDFFNSIKSGSKDINSPKGLFIETLESKTEKFKNVSVLLTANESRICFFDVSSGEYKIIHQKGRGEPSLTSVAKETQWLAMAKTLINTFPSMPEVVVHSSGGQADQWDVFQKVIDTFIGETDKSQFEHVYACLKAAMLDQSDFNFIKEIEKMPPKLQDITVQFLIETKIEPAFLKGLLEKGFINENNWQLVMNLEQDSAKKTQEILLTMLSKKEILEKIDIIEFFKEFQNNDFSFFKSILETILQYHTSERFTSVVPLLIEKRLSDGQDWIISYNTQHKLLDDKELLTLSLKDPTHYIIKKLITDSIVKVTPEIRSLILNELKSNGIRADIEFFDLMDKLLHFTDEEKNQFIDKLFIEAITDNKRDFLLELSSWLHLKDEDKKQTLLRKAFEEALILPKEQKPRGMDDGDREIIQMLLSFGLDVDNPEFVSDLKEILMNDELFKDMPVQFFMDHMKNALDQMSGGDLSQIISSRNLNTPLYRELLNYSFVERKVPISSRVLLNALNRIIDHIKNSEIEKSGGQELVAEWLIKHGADLKDISSSRKEAIFSNNLIPRLIADGCSFDLIKMLLQLKSQSESKETYDRILWISTMKGRVDLLKYLFENGCKFSLEALQRALFYAKERGDAQFQEIINEAANNIK